VRGDGISGDHEQMVCFHKHISGTGIDAGATYHQRWR